MPLQENVGSRLAYKQHTASVCTPGTLLVPATDPGASGGQVLRRVGSTLGLKKDNYQSMEIREDRQVSDMRHGTRRVTGEVNGELSLATYFPFFEAALRTTKVATFSKTNTDFTSMAADSTTHKFTAAASTWAAQNFRVGDVIRFTNMSAGGNNATNFLIYALSGVDAFVTPDPVTQSADTTFQVDRVGTKATVPVTSATFIKRLWAFEHYHQDSDETQLFTECRVGGFRVRMPATGLMDVSFPFQGRQQTLLTGASAPFFTAPTAAGTDPILAAIGGKVVYKGSAVGVITGLEFNVQMAINAPPVIGQDFTPEIFLGRTVVTGQLTALYDDNKFLTDFANETEVELLTMAVSNPSLANSPFLAFQLPRMKLNTADLPMVGEAGLEQTCGFQGLLKPVTTGYDNTSFGVIDSNAV